VCGRFSLGVDTDRLIAEFGLASVAVPHEPRYNLAPTQLVPAVVRSEEGPRLGALRWGLIPHGVADPGAGARMINARSETVDRRPSFAGLFRNRRCWVLADGFYEWYSDQSGARVPVHFRLPDGRPFAFAGLWDRWQGDDGDLLSCTILTTEPSEDVRPIHDRMPVILPAPSRDRWLDPDAGSGELKALLRPYPGVLDPRRVSTRVNDPGNDDPRCIEPLR
jgi:putative SOS response-associated peptidase YedK